MRDLIAVAKFTIKEMVKRKSFLISNLIILLLVVIGFNVPNFMEAIQGDTTAEDGIVWVIDSSNVYQGSLEALNQMELGYKFEIKIEDISTEEIKDKINAGDIIEAVVVKQEQGNVKIDYIVDSLGMGGNEEMYRQIFSEMYKNIKMAQEGLTAEQIQSVNQNVDIEITELKEGSSGGTLVVMMMLCIVLFYAIYFCAYQVSSTITTEKTSKIMETLVTSTTPRTIVLGKTIGIGIVGLGQVLAIAITAFISYKLFLPEGILEGIIDITKLTPQFIIMTIIYFLLGYTLYAFLYALTGSTVSKPEDVQSANGPVAILAVIGFYLAYFSMMNTTSSINTFASILPISSPFSMPFRIVGGMATTSEILISVGVLILTIAIVANIAIKIYSSAILHYGTKLSIKDLFKMYKEK